MFPIRVHCKIRVVTHHQERRRKPQLLLDQLVTQRGLTTDGLGPMHAWVHRRSHWRPFSCFCSVCKKKISCKHQGELDLKRHLATASHAKFAMQLQTQQKLGYSSDDVVATKVSNGLPIDDAYFYFKCSMQTIRAEVKLSTMLAQRNIPLAFADHLI